MSCSVDPSLGPWWFSKFILQYDTKCHMSLNCTVNISLVIYYYRAENRGYNTDWNFWCHGLLDLSAALNIFWAALIVIYIAFFLTKLDISYNSAEYTIKWFLILELSSLSCQLKACLWSVKPCWRLQSICKLKKVYIALQNLILYIVDRNNMNKRQLFEV